LKGIAFVNGKTYFIEVATVQPALVLIPSWKTDSRLEDWWRWSADAGAGGAILLLTLEVVKLRE
jgi:hypothetical protein